MSIKLYRSALPLPCKLPDATGGFTPVNYSQVIDSITADADSTDFSISNPEATGTTTTPPIGTVSANADPTAISLSNPEATGSTLTPDITTTDTDSVYILATVTPATPTGGESIEQHTPAGWTRTEPTATVSASVYRSQRTRTFENSVFTGATAWVAPTITQNSLPATTASLRSSAFAQETEEVWLLLLTITHPDLTDDIRVVQDKQLVTSRGNDYQAFGFDVSLPLDAPDRPPEARIIIDNVSQELIESIRKITDAPAVTIEFIRAADPDTVELSWTNFTLRNIGWNEQRITGVLTHADIITEAFPSDNFTPSSFRGLI